MKMRKPQVFILGFLIIFNIVAEAICFSPLPRLFLFDYALMQQYLPLFDFTEPLILLLPYSFRRKDLGSYPRRRARYDK